MLLNESEMNSSALDKAMYNFETNTLKIQFKSGKIYEYENVDQSVYQRLCEAESQGKFFHDEIKNNYSHIELL